MGCRSQPAVGADTSRGRVHCCANTHLTDVLAHHVTGKGNGLALASGGTCAGGTQVGVGTSPEVLVCRQVWEADSSSSSSIVDDSSRDCGRMRSLEHRRESFT